MIVYHLILALGLAALFFSLAPARPELSSGRKGAAFILLSLFASFCLLWVRDLRPEAARAFFFPPKMTADMFLSSALPCLLLGVLSFGATGFSRRQLARGAVVAGFSCAIGYFGYQWIGIGQAFGRLDHPFAPWAARALLPAAFTVSLALIALASLHDDFAGKRLPAPGIAGAGVPPPLRNGSGLPVVLAVLLVWGTATELVRWRLVSAWGYGPRSLLEAAGIDGIGRAPEVIIADLWSDEGGLGAADSGYRIYRRTHGTGAISLSAENIKRLEQYLKGHRYRSVFALEALEAVRRGWLLWWAPDLALDAYTVDEGIATPDYRQALALLRAGPLTDDNYRTLKDLMLAALRSKKGFENVTQSQYIFEAFCTAFGRFGDSEKARFWLGKIDGLWPVYEKKIDVAPVEAMADGEISGRVEAVFGAPGESGGESRPAEELTVALFYLPSSTATYKDDSNMCCSAYPDAAGRFKFSNLGEGSYRLALMGGSLLLRGRVEGSPGTIELSESRPIRRLDPIVIRND